MTSLLSVKPIDPKDRLIVALDVPDADAARAVVIELGDEVVFYKIGLELFMTSGYFELLEWLVGQGKKVFVDLKFFDVPETVRSAVRALAGSGAAFATIHGNQAIMEAAVKEDVYKRQDQGRLRDADRCRLCTGDGVFRVSARGEADR